MDDYKEDFDRSEERIVAAAKLRDLRRKDKKHLVAEYKKRSHSAFAPETLRLYNGIIDDFKKWCKSNGYRHQPPISAAKVAEYVESLGGKVRPRTIETRLWALAEYHRENLLPSPTKDRLVKLAVRGVKRAYGNGTRQASPLRKREVLNVISKLGETRIDLRDKAALWIASDSWCRSSEVLAFKVRDVIRQEDGSSLLFIARSKTDQFGEGAYAYLSPAGTRAVFEWVEVAGLKLNDPIVTKSQPGGVHQPLAAATLSRILKRLTGRKDVSVHSTRVGGVHDAFSLGCDLANIMVAGRWKSPEMPAHYGRRILAGQSAAAVVCSAFDETK